jgi:TP901 family phage tail tape measure protein
MSPTQTETKIILTAEDKATGKILRVEQSVKTLEKAMSGNKGLTRAFIKADLAVSAIKKSFSLLNQGIRYLSGHMKAAANAFADFEFTLQQVANLGDFTTHEMEGLGEAIRNLAVEGTFGIQGTAEAFEKLAGLGTLTATEMEVVMEAANDLALATHSELTPATEALAISMNIFGLSAEEAARTADILTNAANLSALELTDMSAALRYVGPSAAAAGSSIEETAALLAILSNAGMSATQSGTGLSRVYSALINPVGEASDQLRRLGVSVWDEAGNMKDMVTILNELGASVEGMIDEEALPIFYEIFGERAGRAFLTLLREQSEAGIDWADSVEGMTEAILEEGTAAEKAAAAMGTLKGRWNQIKTIGEELKISFGEAVFATEEMDTAITAVKDVLADPAMKEAIQALGKVIGEVLGKSIKMLLPALEKAMPAIIRIAESFGRMFDAAMPLIDLFLDMGIQIINFTADILESLEPSINQLLEAITPIVEVIRDSLGPLLEDLVPIITSLVEPITGLAIGFSETLGGALKVLTDEDGLLAGFKVAMEDIGEVSKMFDDFVGGIVAWISEIITQLEESIGLFRDFMNALRTIEELGSAAHEDARKYDMPPLSELEPPPTEEPGEIRTPGGYYTEPYDPDAKMASLPGGTTNHITIIIEGNVLEETLERMQDIFLDIFVP